VAPSSGSIVYGSSSRRRHPSDAGRVDDRPRGQQGSIAEGYGRAEDLVSEVFIDVWSQAGRFEGRSQVSTWILSIARFKALTERYRRRDAKLDEIALERRQSRRTGCVKAALPAPRPKNYIHCNTAASLRKLACSPRVARCRVWAS
jgi:hypothetical protein